MSQAARNGDDVVMSAEQARVDLPLVRTADACVGAVAAYLMRRIAFRAGAYAPGIQDRMFHDLSTARAGASLAVTQRWLEGNLGALHQQGYRLFVRWCAEPTELVTSWVNAGRGHRGALLATSLHRLHLDAPVRVAVDHAVGLIIERRGDDDRLVQVDAWPGPGPGRADGVPAELDAARREARYHALIFYWVGWS